MNRSEFTAKRLSMGYSQEALAEALGMTGKYRSRTLRAWESAKEPLPKRAQENLQAMWEEWIMGLGDVLDTLEDQALKSGEPASVDLVCGGSDTEEARLRALLILAAVEGYRVRVVPREA